MHIKKLATAAASATAAFFATADMAVPNVTAVTLTQPSNTRTVTITYSVDADAVVTLDIQTNAVANAATGWCSIGGVAVANAFGDVWKRVGAGAHAISWNPADSWPDHRIADGCARAVVTAWALDNTPDYMVVGLDAPMTNYYPAVDYLPGVVPGQVGTITNNPAYRTTKLVLRKIMARGVQWTMGSSSVETQRTTADNREDAHVVTLTNNYYIGVFEITQRQWAQTWPSSSTPTFAVEGDMRPMENVSFNEIRNSGNTTMNSSYNWPNPPHTSSFLGRLKDLTGIYFELPSEAQWEFAARAGNGSGYWGDGSKVLNTSPDANLDRIGRYSGNVPGGTTVDATLSSSEGGTAIVGSYAPNNWGLYDMHGNVTEWCLDFYDDDIRGFGGLLNVDPENSAKKLSGGNGGNHVIRGGRWNNIASVSRSAFRLSSKSDVRNEYLGCRVICTAGLK